MFFYSKTMEHKHKITDAGYYRITLSLKSGHQLLRSNNERAFVMSQLQDLLGRRSLLEEPGSRYRLSAHLDLLAFSILDQAINFIVFSIAKNSALAFAQIVMNRLQTYQSEWNLAPSFQPSYSNEPSITVRRLSGPYEALDSSVSLHARHRDWEYDRYSSIGFYLHDRRGDWVHLWRLSRLYENDTELYRQLILNALALKTDSSAFSKVPRFVPLLRG